jgi:hypothetical protein
MKSKKKSTILIAEGNHALNDISVSDEEMDELKPLFSSLRKGLKDAKEGRYRKVEFGIEKRKDAYK